VTAASTKPLQRGCAPPLNAIPLDRNNCNLNLEGKVQNKSALTNLVERYDSGEHVVRAIFDFARDGGQSPREYRLFAERSSVRNGSAVSPKDFTVHIDALVTISCGDIDVHVWQSISIPGVMEGSTAQEALEHALQALNGRAVGHSHDDETTGLKVMKA